jgi:hypothetical protein
MANVPMHFSATVQDGVLARTSTDVYLELPEATTLTQLAAALGTWLTTLDGISSGNIIATKVEVKPALPTLKSPTAAAFAASRINQNGQFRFSASGVTTSWSSNVPALANAALVSGTDKPDPAVVGTYTSLLTSGVYANPQNDILLTLTRSRVTTHKHRKAGV